MNVPATTFPATPGAKGRSPAQAENVSVVRAEIFALLRGSKRSVLVYAHSKGALDAAAVIHDLSPAEKERVCGFVACQGPFGGAAPAPRRVATGRAGADRPPDARGRGRGILGLRAARRAARSFV